ncbi:MAG: hypothetical protein ACRDV9_08025 [Acidimicrobiia bacterium]
MTPARARQMLRRGRGVLPLAWGVAVRDVFPEPFLDFHLAAFRARFERRAAHL